MSDQEAGEVASRDQIADLEAFEAKFKPEDFAGVAQALRLAEDPETLSWLRDLLLPEFRFFVESCSGAKATREEQISRLEKVHQTATDLDGLLGPGGSRSGLPRRFWGSNLITDQFTETLRVLALEAGRQIQRLRSSPGKRGRPRKDAARQLGKDLIRVYEKLLKKGGGGDLTFRGFYRFAAAASRCLRAAVPAIDSEFPPSPSGLRDEFREIWNSVIKKKPKKPVSLKTNNSAYQVSAD